MRVFWSTQENSMRKIFWPAFAATMLASAMSFTADIRPADAMIVYPWCAHYGGRGGVGAPSCGFVTFAQCMATVSGMQGYCDRNPWYEERPATARRTTKRVGS
jgi:hypothetical protein